MREKSELKSPIERQNGGGLSSLDAAYSRMNRTCDSIDRTLRRLRIGVVAWSVLMLIVCAEPLLVKL